MAEHANHVAATIAGNVRALRAQRGLTLDGLVAVTGLSKGTLVALEQARANPSIGTLCQLSESLGIGLHHLLEDRSRPFAKVRRRDEGAVLWSTERGSSARFLIGTDPPDGLELWSWRIAPGEHFDGGAHPVGTRELLAISSGRLELRLGDQSTHLAAGDSMLFEATLPHLYACRGADPVDFAMTVLIADLSGLGPIRSGRAPDEELEGEELEGEELEGEELGDDSGAAGSLAR